MKIVISGSNFSNISGRASGMHINNMTNGNIEVEIDNTSISHISSGGKGIKYTNTKGGKWPPVSEITDRFPSLYNVHIWTQSPDNTDIGTVTTKKGVIKENYSSNLYRDQNGNGYIMTFEFEVSTSKGEKLITENDFKRLDPIHINENWIGLYQPLREMAPNFGAYSHTNTQVKTENVKNSCNYFILLELKDVSVTYLTGRDVCIPWQDDFATMPTYDNEGLELIRLPETIN